MKQIIGIVIVVLIMVSVNYTYAQNYAFDPLLTKCVIHKDDHLVILDLSAEQSTDCVIYYSNQGFEIKAILQTIMYLQK